MPVRHTVIFTLYDSTTEAQINDLVSRLNEAGDYAQQKLDVTDWIVAKHLPETFKAKRAHLLQEGIFPSLEALQKYNSSDAHQRIITITPKICDWMTIDTLVPDSL